MQRRIKYPLKFGALVLALLPLVACEKPNLITDAVPRPPLSDVINKARETEPTELLITDHVVRDDDLLQIAELQGLKHVAIDRFEGTGDSLQRLAMLPRLERLQLRGGVVGDAEAKAIAACKTLTNINLPEAGFTDSGLDDLAALPVLEFLRFHSPNITNDGLKHLAESTSLRFLHLIAVPIDDEGLVHLQAMKQLESLYIDDAEITDDGIERLLKALPDLHFHINQQHSDRDPSKGTHPHSI